MADSEIVRVNDYGLYRRTSKTGRQRYTVSIKSEPILVQTSARALGKGPADAIAEIYRDRIKAITARASPATIRARETAAKALTRGEAWANRRYGGGRMGARVPNQSDRLFNDSGRMAESIAVGAAGDKWIVNMAGNRLDPSTLNGGEVALQRIFELLRQYVPELDANRLGDNMQFHRALKTANGMMLRKSTEQTAQLTEQLMKSGVGLLMQLTSLAG